MTGRAALRAAIVALIVAGLDQATKALVIASIDRGEEDPVLPGVTLVNTRNEGVAFGLFEDGAGVVLAVGAATLLLVVVWFVLKPQQPLALGSVGLLVGGAAGNLIDRATRGSVVDFVDLPLWPAFNLADAAITVGVVLLVLLASERDGDRAAPDPG